MGCCRSGTAIGDGGASGPAPKRSSSDRGGIFQRWTAPPARQMTYIQEGDEEEGAIDSWRLFYLDVVLLGRNATLAAELASCECEGALSSGSSSESISSYKSGELDECSARLYLLPQLEERSSSSASRMPIKASRGSSGPVAPRAVFFSLACRAPIPASDLGAAAAPTDRSSGDCGNGFAQNGNSCSSTAPASSSPTGASQGLRSPDAKEKHGHSAKEKHGHSADKHGHNGVNKRNQKKAADLKGKKRSKKYTCYCTVQTATVRVHLWPVERMDDQVPTFSGQQCEWCAYVVLFPMDSPFDSFDCESLQQRVDELQVRARQQQQLMVDKQRSEGAGSGGMSTSRRYSDDGEDLRLACVATCGSHSAPAQTMRQAYDEWNRNLKLRDLSAGKGIDIGSSTSLFSVLVQGTAEWILDPYFRRKPVNRGSQMGSARNSSYSTRSSRVKRSSLSASSLPSTPIHNNSCQSLPSRGVSP